MTSPIITAQDAAALRGDPSLVILDVRWRLGQADGHELYLAEHLPGAVFVDLDSDLADPPGNGRGRHPLPDVDRFSDAVAGWGITPGSAVVVYDDWNSMAAARVWWMLDAAGLVDVRVLDGGIRAWKRHGLPTEAGETGRQPVHRWVTGFGDRLLDADGAWAHVNTTGALLFDARATERYDGSTEPMDSRAGHIPGAVSAPTTGNVDLDGVFLPRELLIERFERLGATGGRPLAAYCGSGVTAAHEILALRQAGFDASLYAGSWSEWSSLPDRPIAIGDGGRAKQKARNLDDSGPSYCCGDRI